MTDGSLCAMGGLTPMPVRSAVKHFPEDFLTGRCMPPAARMSEIRSHDACDQGNRLRNTGRTPTARNMVTLDIDGQAVTVPDGTSIMRAAMAARHQGAEALRHRHARAVRLLPPLPRRDRRPQGHAGLLHHAGRPRHQGQDPDDRLAALRKGVMELYISDHPLDCLTCAANGDCELQDMAGAVGLRDVRYGYEGDNHVFARRGRRSQYPLQAQGRDPIPISPSIRPNASSARAACAPARKSRARSR